MLDNEIFSLLDSQQQSLASEKDAIVERTRLRISQYWDWFNEQNTRIANLRKTGNTTFKTSNIAPVIEVRERGNGSTEADYNNVSILWKNHNPQFRKNLRKKTGANRHASKPLHTKNSNYIISILQKRCTWDADKAIEFETYLQQVRIAINGLHQAIMRLRSAKRMLELRQQTNDNDEIHHDETPLEEISHVD
jgi:hypothetical protein